MPNPYSYNPLLLRILDRYLLREFAGPLLFGVFMFSMLIVTTAVLAEALRFIQRYNLPPGMLLKLLALGSPEFVILSIPMGALLGTLLAVGRLNADHEIVALRACGLGLYRVLAPLLAVGAVLAGLTLVGSETLVPMARNELLWLKNQVRAGRLGASQQRVMIPIREGGQLRWVLSAGALEGSRLTDINLFYFDPKSEFNDFWLEASEATWTGNHWNFRDLRQKLIQSGGSGEELVVITTRELDIPDFNIEPADLEQQRRSAEDVSAAQLRSYIADLLRRQSAPRGTAGELSDLRDLSRAVRERAFAETPTERLIVPVHEGGELRWLVIAEQVDAGELAGVKLFYFDARAEENDFAVSAARAVWTGREWIFYNMRRVQVHAPDSGLGEIALEQTGTVPEFALSPDSLELRVQMSADLDSAGLRRRIAELESSISPVDKSEIRDLQTKLHFKYSIPLTPLFFIWIAFPLAILPQRSSSTRGMGIALLVVLGYYALYTTFQRLGGIGLVPPLVAAWAPNALLAGVGWHLMRVRSRS